MGIGFGEVLLTGDFAKKYSDSIGVDVVYDYKASELFGLLLDLNYSKHTNDSGLNVLKIRGITPNLRVNLSYFDKFTAYAIAGFGIYGVSETIGLYSGSVTTFGFNAGPGFDLRLADHLKFGSLIAFHNIFTKSDPEARNPGGKGLSIGGTFLRLFLTLQYVF